MNNPASGGIVHFADLLYCYWHMKKPLHHHLHDFFLPTARNEYHPNMFSRVSVIVLAVIIIGCEVGYVAQTKFVFLNTDFLASVLPSVLTTLTNADRAESGLAPLTRNPLLDAAAQAAAEDMATKGYFSHVAPDGATPWSWLDKAGYVYSYAGQNLAVNFTDSQNVETAWLESPTHRENILKPHYTEIGFGTANGLYEGQETTFVVEFFGTPVTEVARTVASARAIAKASASPTPQATSTQVLGTEVKNTAVPQEAPLLPATQSFLTMLSSPLTALETIFTALLVLIALVYGITVFMHGKMLHSQTALGGAALLLLISAAFLVSALLSSSVQLASNAQMASVVAALPR